MENKICGLCNFCETEDGFPFCYLKDLYTEVKLDRFCDELDSKGRMMFSEKNTVKHKN